MAGPARMDTRMRVAKYRDWIAPRPAQDRESRIGAAAPAFGEIVEMLCDVRDDALMPTGLRPLQHRYAAKQFPPLTVRARGDPVPILSEAMDDYAPIPDVVVQCGEPPDDGYTGDPLLVPGATPPPALRPDARAGGQRATERSGRTRSCGHGPARGSRERGGRLKSPGPAQSSTCPNSAAHCPSRSSMRA
jgi:hypothetical protein